MKTFSMTHVGMRRESNQDFMFTSDTPVGNLPNLLIVADGMGGHAAGDFASRFTVEKVIEYVSESKEKNPMQLLKAAIVYANDLILKEAQKDPEKEGMGTTIVAATYSDGILTTANVGDSRLYVVDHDRISQITVDHSLVEEMVRKGQVSRNDARRHPQKNIITRAIGVFNDVDVDIFETPLKVGSTVLMCTDGLTNMVEDSDIKRIVLSGRDTAEKATSLVNEANKNGGTDNVTVVLMEL